MKKTLFSQVVCVALSVFFAVNVSAQEQISNQVSNIPYKLEVYNNPVSYVVDGNSVVISALGKTNLFNSPGGKSKVQNAPMLLFKPQGDFTLSARVSGDLKAVYDVAAFVVYSDENTWAKFCYENSVLKKPTIVSVVTRTFSDDCNSVLTGKYAYMSVVKKGDEYSFFYSKDGKRWDMIRNFNLDTKGNVKVGFASHGSRGDGFTAKFSEIKYMDKALEDMRDLNL